MLGTLNSCLQPVPLKATEARAVNFHSSFPLSLQELLPFKRKFSRHRSTPVESCGKLCAWLYWKSNLETCWSRNGERSIGALSWRTCVTACVFPVEPDRAWVPSCDTHGPRECGVVVVVFFFTSDSSLRRGQLSLEALKSPKFAQVGWKWGN